MLHYVSQLAADCVCLLFGAEQGVRGGFLAVRLNQNSKAEGSKTKTMSWKWLTIHC